MGIGTLDVVANNKFNGTGTATMDGLTVDGTLASPPIIKISNNGGTWTAGDEFGRLQFYTTDASGIGAREIASIRAVTNSSGSAHDGTLEFWTSPYNTVSKKSMEIDGRTGDISFYEDTGTSQALFWDASAESLGIGTTSPSQALEVAGNIQATGTRSISALYDSNHYMRMEANSSGGILKGTDGGVTTTLVRTYGDSYFNGGNVGIGTTSPEGTLQVENVSNNALILNAPANRYNSVGFQTAGTDKWWLGRADSDQIASDAFFIGVDNGNATDAGGLNAKLVIDTSGKVGIGTTSPATTLDVAGSGAEIAIRDTRNQSWTIGDTVASLGFYSDDTSGGSGSTSNLARGAIDLVTTSTFGSTHDMVFKTRGDVSTSALERLRITSVGNVGIGTTSPSEKLDVAGKIKTSGQIRAGSYLESFPSFSFANDTDTGMFSDTANQLEFSTGGSSRLTINSSGNVGIGTTSPAANLEVLDPVSGNFSGEIQVGGVGSSRRLLLRQDSATEYTIGAKGSGALLKFATGDTPTERMRIDGSTGNVGIGTTSPQNNSGRTTLTLSNATNGGILEIFGPSATRQLLIYNDTGESRFETLSGGSEDIVFRPNGSESVRFDSSGNVHAGGSTSITATVSGDNNAPTFIVEDSLATSIALLRSDTSIVSGNSFGSYAWYGTDTTSNLPRPLAAIQAIASGTHSAGDNPTDIRFLVTPDGTESLSEKMRIDSSGRLLINRTSATGSLSLESQAPSGFSVGSGFHSASTQSTIEFKDANTTANYKVRIGSETDDMVLFAGGSEALRIDSSQRVGIGTTSPEALLHVSAADGVTGVLKIEGGKNTVTSIGEINSQLDFGSNDISVNNPGNIGGRIASVTEFINGAETGMAFYTFDQGATGTDLSEKLRITAEGNVGIGTTSPSEKLHVTGNILASGNVTAYSDERLKDNIQTLQGSKVLEMRGVSYTKDGEASSGVIAQEIEKVAPELVQTAKDEMGTKSVAYGNLVGYLIEAVKDLKAEIDDLKEMVKAK